MRRIALIAAIVSMFVLAASACKKTEQPPPPPPMPGQGMPGQGMAPGMPGQGMPPGMPGQPGGMHPAGSAPEKKVVVPETVKNAWKAVKIEVEYKEKKSKKKFDVPLKSEFKIPDSDLVVKTGDFLPHFAMGADSITSSSNNPENPAVQVEVFQGGKELFHGWLFSKFPSVHPFQHDKFGVTLIEGIKK
jgi:hypothetical protein